MGHEYSHLNYTKIIFTTHPPSSLELVQIWWYEFISIIFVIYAGHKQVGLAALAVGVPGVRSQCDTLPTIPNLPRRPALHQRSPSAELLGYGSWKEPIHHT